MSIKPGNSVEINLDSLSTKSLPLKALIYDVEGKRLVLSQTSPPIAPPPVKRPVAISYLLQEGNSVRRFALSAMISEFVDDYQLASGETVPAIIATITEKPKEASLRKGYRIRPPRQSAITLTIGGREHAIIDISITGISFIQRFSDPTFRSAETLKCLLTIDGRRYPLDVRVIRVSDAKIARHIAAVFLEAGTEIETVMGRKILMLEREELSRKR